MDAILLGHFFRRLWCRIVGHDYRIEVPARCLVNVWCQTCGDPFPNL